MGVPCTSSGEGSASKRRRAGGRGGGARPAVCWRGRRGLPRSHDPRNRSDMILCVTLNPCLDKTLTVPPWRPGDNVRGTAVREVVGGKGNNVARALIRLGRPVRPVTFFGGAVGARCEELMRRD